MKDDFAPTITEALTFKAAEDVRRATLPAKAEDYKIALPADFKPPEGIEFKFNEADQNLQTFRTIAKEAGLTQDQFSKALSLYAGTRVTEAQTLKEARDAELGKLGSTASARISAINQFLDGYLGAEDAGHLKGALWTAGIVQSLEKLITKVATGHGSNFSQQHRDTGKAEVSDETYNSWSGAQKLNYARTGDPNKAGAA